MELQVINQNEISVAFNKPQGIQSIIDNIKSQVDEQINGVVWDLSKKKDRDLIASLAYKVGRSKTAIDAEGKKLKDQYTVFTKAIDADRKLAKEQLEAEQSRIRKPLDDWEDAEKERISNHKHGIQDIKDILKEAIELAFNSNQIQGSIDHLGNIIIDFEGWEEFTQEAHIAKLETLEALRSLLVKRETHEAEQAELEALRQAEILRQQQERNAQIAREATEKAQREAEEKARFEAERVQREKMESEQREARLQAEKEAAELRASQAAENERKRIESEQFAKEEADRKALEAREKDQDHKRQVNQSIIAELGKLGIDEQTGKDLILAIYRGQVPNIKITY